MKQGGTILAIAHSSRAIGYAIADKLGLIDADFISLRDAKTEKDKITTAKRWIAFAIKQLQPAYIVLEEVHPKRLSPITIEIQKILLSEITKYKHCKLFIISRILALDSICKNKHQTQQEYIRELSRTFSRDCELLAFHQPPKTSMRSDWDRSWGQAVVASALAEYTRQSINS